MARQELEQRGVFLPEEVRGEVRFPPTVGAVAASLLGVGALGSCLLMVVGGGGALTWIAAAAFVALLWAFALLARRGIDRQNRRVHELERQAGHRGQPSEEIRHDVEALSADDAADEGGETSG